MIPVDVALVVSHPDFDRDPGCASSFCRSVEASWAQTMEILGLDADTPPFDAEVEDGAVVFALDNADGNAERIASMLTATMAWGCYETGMQTAYSYQVRRS